MNRIVQRLKWVKETRKLSYQKIGVAVGVSRQAIHQLFNGDVNPTLDLSERLGQDVLGLKAGEGAKLGALPPQKLVIFDKDGTLFRSSKGKFINSPEEQVLMAGRRPMLEELKKYQHLIAIASNQGGVAFDIMSYSTAKTILEHAQTTIGADVALFCPHHPQGNNEYGVACDCRKPGVGMLAQIKKDARWPYITKADMVMVGDRVEDKEAAMAFGINFAWAEDYFS